MSRIPWELLLPSDPDAPVLWLGASADLIATLRENWHVETSEKGGPFSLIVRVSGGPAAGLNVSLRNLLKVDGHSVFDRRQSTESGVQGPGSAAEYETSQHHHFFARKRSLVSESGSWAQPLRGAGKAQLLLTWLRDRLPGAAIRQALESRCKVSLILPARDRVKGSWLFELIDDLSNRGVTELDAASLARIDATENGAAIVQILTRDGAAISLKIALESRVADELIREFESVKRLRSHEALGQSVSGALPRVIEASTFRGRSYRLDEWLAGRPAVELMYKTGEREHVVDHATDWISALHSETRGPPLDPVAAAGRARSVLVSIAERAGLEDQGFAEQLGDYLESRLDRLAIPTVFGHGDYWLGNLIYEPGSHEIKGVIDWNFADEQAPPLEDLLHLLCHRKGFFSVYDAGFHLSSFLKRTCSNRDRRRIKSYLRALELDPAVAAPLAILYWVRYLDSRDPTLGDRRGWYRRSYARVRATLAKGIGAELDGVEAWLALN